MRENVSLIMVCGLLHVAERVLYDKPERGPQRLDWEQLYRTWPEHPKYARVSWVLTASRI